MKAKLMHYIVSSGKKEPFSLITFKKEGIEYDDGSRGEEIIDGLLITKSGEWYPIISGVPRIITGGLKKDLFDQHPEFVRDYMEKIQEYISKERIKKEKFSEINKKTISKFGFQWNYFEDMDSGLNYDDWMSKAVDHKTSFKGRLGLEVGSGAGGHTLKTLGYGAEVIATDISHAIDITYKKTKSHPKSHSVQADIYNLPFREKSFDFVYCLGVIQHLPDPPRGFKELSRYVKKGGSLFTNLYSNTRKFQLFAEDAIRFFVKPWPNIVILFFAHVFNILDHLMFIWPYQIYNRIGLKFMLKIYPSRTAIYSRLGFRKSLDDWFDRLSAPIIKRYPKEALVSWYKKEGYKDILVYDFNNSNWVGYGKLR